MLPFNDSFTPNSATRSLENQQAYRELIHHLSQFFSEETLTERLNVEQMFILVDGVLPIEACLYYQVLPLFLDGSRLHLGMVNPEDSTASDYVRRIVSYLNYSLLTRRISSQALQAALSAYLKYSDSQSSTARQSASPAPTPEPEISPSLDEASASQSSYSKPPHNLETNSRETLVLDSPDQLDASDILANPQGETVREARFPEGGNDSPILPADELTCIDPEQTEIISFDNADDIQTQLLTPEEFLDADAPTIVTPPSDLPLSEGGQNSRVQPQDNGIAPAADSPFSDAPVTDNSNNQSFIGGLNSSGIASSSPGALVSEEEGAAPLSMQVQPDHLDKAIDDLAALTPRDLLRELLARAMSGGIGRLYFERKPEYGRVLWSQSGILQAAVDNVQPVKFQALINEFKRLTRLPLLPLNNTKQVELERFYKGNRVLLRFRFIPGKHGEQATLQVLRGAALTFYQQQQVARIGQDAVSTAKRLQVKISELRSRLEAYPRVSNPEQASLPELKQMLLNLEKQVDALSGVVMEHQQEQSDVPPLADTP